MCNRTGLGKVRHMDLQMLWLQEAVRVGKLVLRKVSGATNPADLMTKYLASESISKAMIRLGMHWEDAREGCSPI